MTSPRITYEPMNAIWRYQIDRISESLPTRGRSVPADDSCPTRHRQAYDLIKVYDQTTRLPHLADDVSTKLEDLVVATLKRGCRR